MKIKLVIKTDVTLIKMNKQGLIIALTKFLAINIMISLIVMEIPKNFVSPVVIMSSELKN